MKDIQRTLAAVAAVAMMLAMPAVAAAQDAADPRGVGLHVGDWHDECYFDLHHELTEAQFRRFAAEGGHVVRFRQLAGAGTLGAGMFDVGLGYSYTIFDDSVGAWNNTMSHPQADHYLGPNLGLPYLELRYGVTDDVDAEMYGSVNPNSNYGVGGVAAKVRLIEENERIPVSVSVRPSVSALFGPEEVQAYNLATDVSVSRSFGVVSPFVGVTFSGTLAVDSSDDTDVGNQVAFRPSAFAGVDFRWKFLSVGGQAEIADVPALSMRLGGRF